MVDEEPEYDDEDQYSTKTRLPKFIMKDAILKDFISDPHQHIMYEYDFLHPKVFYIELLKVLPEQDGVSYPRCTHKVKEMPKDNKNLRLPNPDDDYVEDLDLEDDDLGTGFDDGYDDLDLSGFDELKEF